MILDDGREKKRFHLEPLLFWRSDVCPMIWRALDNFSSGSVCMALVFRMNMTRRTTTGITMTS